jgi:ribose transport system permease protein
VAETATPRILTRSRGPVSRGLITVLVSTAGLYILSALFAPTSITAGPQLGMLAFAAVLAIVGLGQMLVVQQGGIDLSVPGAVSLAAVIASHQPNGDDSKLLMAVVTAYAFSIAAGLLNGYLVGILRLSPIIATLGTNALLFGAVLFISGGTPRVTTQLLQDIVHGLTWGIPNELFFVAAITVIVTLVLKKTTAGRRFEGIGSSGAATKIVGLRVKTHNSLAYLWAQLLFTTAGVMLAGVTNQPTAFQGNSYLLPSVAVVVLGGTSLLGGRGLPVATVIAALFLTQLDQFVLALGVPFAIRTLVQAGALGIGVAAYTINWSGVRMRLKELLSTLSDSDGKNKASSPPV